MPAVSLDYLRGLTPRAIQPLNRATIEAGIQSALESGLDDWNPAQGGQLKAALAILADQLWTHAETANSNWRAGLLPFAVSTDLDILGVTRGIARTSGESDDSYRERMANFLPGSVPVTLEQYDALAKNFNSQITDLQAVVATNRQDVTLYALKGADAALTSTERTALQEYFNHTSRKPAGRSVTVSATTAVSQNVTMTIRYPTREDSTVVEAAVKAQITAYFKSLNLGDKLYKTALQGAAFNAANVLDAVATVPAADANGANGRLYTEGTVTLTMTAV